MRDKGRWKLPPANLLGSSSGRNWSGIGAERRRHSAGELPQMISNITVIGLAVAGNRDAVIHRRGNGIRQATPASTGTIWLCPQGVFEDSIRITDTIPEILHIYLPAEQFSALSREDNYPDLRAELVSYEAGFHDPLIAQIGRIVLSELAQETSSGKLLVETAALTLAAQLVHAYSSVALSAAARSQPPHALDERRLQRVTAFVEANLENDIGVQDLAHAACLSQFHFSRAFKKLRTVSSASDVSRERRVCWRKGDSRLGKSPRFAISRRRRILREPSAAPWVSRPVNIDAA
jgi:AraC family transcriptional regulator